MAGVAGLEPTHARIKIWCLTDLAIPQHLGMPAGIRTPDPRLRRAMLYPAELQTHNGAGEGNRTLATGLEGQGSTTELHPHMFLFEIIVVEMAGFEPAKAKLTDLQSVPFNHSETPPWIV